MRCSAIVVTYNSGESIGRLPGSAHPRGLRDRRSRQRLGRRHRPPGRGVCCLASGSPHRQPAESRLRRRCQSGRTRGYRRRAADPQSGSVAEPGAVAALLHCMQSTRAAAVGGALLESDGQPARGFAFRRLPTLWALVFEATLVNQLWPGNPINRRYRCLDADYSQQQEVEQPAGACLAITHTTWDNLGGFDEQFFPVWFEDVDLCKRLRDAGRKNLLLPAGEVPSSRRPQRGTIVIS